MNRLKSASLVAIGALALSGAASANDNIWFGVKAGTLGLGVEASWRPIEWLDLRAGGNYYNYDDSGAEAGVNYDATLALNTYYVTGNLSFPLSPFRLTAGAFVNNNEVRLVSRDASSFSLGDNTQPYLASDVGTLHSVTSFDGVAPYVGAGFDFDLLDRLGLSLDFGVLWQGDPKTSLTADGPLANDPGLLSDLEVESRQLAQEFDNLKAYPVVSIGFNFNFN